MKNGGGGAVLIKFKCQSLSVVALSFGLIEIVGLVLACCLGDRIHRAKHYHRFNDILMKDLFVVVLNVKPLFRLKVA